MSAKRSVQIILLLALFHPFKGISQKYMASIDQHYITDSLSTMFFPIRHNDQMLSTNKIAILDDLYANIKVYDFVKDEAHMLFDHDTFIHGFQTYYSSSEYGYGRSRSIRNITKQWILLLVKSHDLNQSGRIDANDPSVLFVCSPQGGKPQQITKPNENVVGFAVYEQLGFALLEIQKDSNGSNSFSSADKVFYKIKLNLADLTLGKPF